MEKNNTSASPGLPFFVKSIIRLWDTKILKHFFSNFKSLFLPINWIFKTAKTERTIGSRQVLLGQDEVKMVMKRLGIGSGRQEDNDIYEQIGEEEILQVFEEEEPSMEELKEAFGVFDENKDGFIDASELGKVLCSLGLVKEEEEEECSGTNHDEWLRMMIKAVDKNQDGVIDFNEFLKFMEESCFI